MSLFRKVAHSPGPLYLLPDLTRVLKTSWIKVVANVSDAVVELKGNREKTWTHRNGTFWPGALLSQDFPRARIMVFGYDADVSLAYDLLDQQGQAGQRPIVFIAHSLGGLVCEEALNLCGKIQNPHRGSHLASWGNTVAKYVNIFRGTNREILRNLQSGFQHMVLCDEVKLKIYCFYEALNMNDIVGTIVERESAILRTYDNCSINADHRDITKFAGKVDTGYGQVQGLLEIWIQEHFVLWPIFNGSISGNYVIPGTQVTGLGVYFLTSSPQGPQSYHSHYRSKFSFNGINIACVGIIYYTYNFAE
ncbi:hypothetical protein CC78DRAFT_551989 [Lojkania enalia]|uniref:DUF676 domain-containing protein n=1 Tax=Lojkania enalia TaxID=147567 RepID=A0A9P4KDN6_9PLEO|nr:hypothetical protein CC78DRAFT_551989 [Didymosphaeria enalia]